MLTFEDAKSVLDSLEEERKRLLTHKESNPAWHNCDEWGSISGIKDAEKYVKDGLAKHLMKLITEIEEYYN
jgi:hypothetical protein